MALVTALEVEVDREEYSKLESGRDVVTATIWPTPQDATIRGQVLTVEFVKARRARDVVVVDQTYTVPVTYNDGPIVVTFNLPEINAVPEGWSLVRRGQYFIHAITADETVEANSVDFRLSLMTVDHLKESYLFGLPLHSNDTRTAKFQPRVITGTVIKEVSRGHPVTFFPFRLDTNGNNRMLSWSGGPSIPIVGGTRQQLMLPGSQGAEYIVVEVNPRLLPTSASGASEAIYIEQDVLGESSLRRWIDNTCDYLEHEGLMVYIEPTSLVTDIDPTAITFSAGAGLSPVVLNYDYDFIKTPVTYYPVKPGSWINIQLPFPSLLRIDSLFGAVANTRIVDVNLEWLEISERTGFTELVPFNQEIAFDFIGLVWVEALRGNVPLPNFWHYALISGLREVPGEILNLIGWKAAIPALTVAGQAYRGGFSSQSLSRDGISESVSFTSSAIYGVYSSTIETYRNNVKETLEKVRQKWMGAGLYVV